jgi:hypothetical protein
MATQSWFQRNKKDVAILAGVIVGLVVGVMGWHWTDTANKPFWWNFWLAAALACDLAWLGFWIFFWNKDKAKRKA